MRTVTLILEIKKPIEALKTRILVIKALQVKKTGNSNKKTQETKKEKSKRKDSLKEQANHSSSKSSPEDEDSNKNSSGEDPVESFSRNKKLFRYMLYFSNFFQSYHL